ncbi:hypothetical protein HFO74_15095 [Rhizobium laguerreae]|uniref:Uncharacterized protein n=1 Tax=Rhizobium laguerreae TaxID=1076926 RepID=A0AB35FGR0_9HYPH|nr:hypothetical protein [Rhizobium laguerreae]MBY3064746.1 hypothetical protein [Rhizobium laguerreae]
MSRLIKADTFDAVMMAGRYTLLDCGAEADLLPEAERVKIVVAGSSTPAFLRLDSALGDNIRLRRAARGRYLSGDGDRRNCNRDVVPLQGGAIQFHFRNPQVSAAVLGHEPAGTDGAERRLGGAGSKRISSLFANNRNGIVLARLTALAPSSAAFGSS